VPCRYKVLHSVALQGRKRVFESKPRVALHGCAISLTLGYDV